MAKIIVLGAMKGGVGKSVSTYNLAYSLNKLGKKVLVVRTYRKRGSQNGIKAQDYD